MFKKALFAFVVAGSINAQATSLHPCTPTVLAAPTFINCAQDGKYYSIRIDTYMSPAGCTGSNRYETKTATVVVSNNSKKLASTTLAANEFTYTLSRSVTFTSEAIGLHLNKCVAPMHGAGFSGSN